MISPYATSTASGIDFDLTDPRPEAIEAEALAHQSGFITRWNGNVAFEYPVLHHTLIVAEAMPNPAWRAYGLLHDAVEALCFGDIGTPVKHLMVMCGFDIIGYERRALAVVYARFDLAQPTPEIAEAIDLADAIALATEYRDVKFAKSKHRQPPEKPLTRTIQFRDRETCKHEWLTLLPNYIELAHQSGLRRAA